MTWFRYFLSLQYMSFFNWIYVFMLLRSWPKNIFSIGNPNQKLYINAKFYPSKDEDSGQPLSHMARYIWAK